MLVNNEKEIEELVAECVRSNKVFAQSFFPQAFTKPFSQLHEEIFTILDDPTIQRAVIAAPRGIGKSTIVGTVYAVRRIVLRETRYIVPVSATNDSAVEQGEEIKNALIDNEDLQLVFGNFEPQRQEDQFGQKAWVTSTGCKVLPRGAGQQIRGRKHKMVRPDTILVDDLENDEDVESEEGRDKLKRWFLSALLNSVDISLRQWRVIVIGTVLHEDSLLSNLLNPEQFPRWARTRLELWDDFGHSNWPAHISDQGIAELLDEYRRAGKLEVAYREFRNIPIAKEDQGFKAEYFRYYDQMGVTEAELMRNPDVTSVILADPARTMTKGSADTAVTCVAVNTVTNALYVRDIEAGKFSPDQMYDAMLNMAQRTGALVLAPEVTGLNEYVTFPLKNEMIRRGLHYIVAEVKPREGKTGPKRSAGLIPLYRQGLVWHNSRIAGKLERYLLQWPRPEMWDIIDTVSGILFVLEHYEQYFEPLEDASDPEDEFRELEYEPAFEGGVLI